MILISLLTIFKLVLIYKLLQLIGNPTVKLKKIIKKLRLPYRKLRYADYVRYYYIGNLYQKPSKIIETLYKLSKNKEDFLKFLTINNSQSENWFDDVLRQILKILLLEFKNLYYWGSP